MRALFLLLPWAVAAQTATYNIQSMQGNRFALEVFKSKLWEGALDRKVPLESLRAGGVAMCPIFYLNYNHNPVDEPWADTIGSALKAYKQAMSYNVQLPYDFGGGDEEDVVPYSQGANVNSE